MVIITVTLNTSVDRTLEVPGFEVGGHLRGRLLAAQPAGKGVNVARCLDALGVPSVVAGLVGRREEPLFRESFEGTRVDLQLTPVADATRVNTTLLDPERGTDTHIRERGFQVAPPELAALERRLRGLAGAGALVVFCGSLPPGIDAAALRRLLAACQEAGARVGADLGGQELAVAVAARAGLITPNVLELGELLGRELEAAAEGQLVEAARGLLDRVGTVLVTRGADGALAVSRDGTTAGRATVERPRNTVGCGDAFLAGYLAALWRGQGPEERLRLALGCGAASALAEAAGQLDAGQARRLAERATLRPLS
ncbi:MAG: 1-phosphofructokinase family hexose kinase [Candidatus Brocadiia bacterium]